MTATTQSPAAPFSAQQVETWLDDMREAYPVRREVQECVLDADGPYSGSLDTMSVLSLAARFIEFDAAQFDAWWKRHGRWFLDVVHPTVDGVSPHAFATPSHRGYSANDAFRLFQIFPGVDVTYRPFQVDMGRQQGLFYRLDEHVESPEGVNYAIASIAFRALSELAWAAGIRPVKAPRAKEPLDLPRARVAPKVEQVRPEDRSWMPLSQLKGLDAIEIAPPTLDTLDGWLSPEGDLHPCAEQAHNELAHAFAVRRGLAGLEGLGWMKLTRSFGVGWVRRRDGGEPTAPQLTAIHAWCEAHRAPVPEWAPTLPYAPKPKWMRSGD